jgi:HEAT repeat protein
LDGREVGIASAAFERFRFSFFDDPDSPRDGLDTVALTQLEGEERVRAEDMLIQYLPDTRGVIGLGALGSRRALPLLLRLFEAEQGSPEAERGPDGDWFPSGLTYLARALWQIDPDPRWSKTLIDVLASSGLWTQRMDAAVDLNDVREPAAVAALIKALDDPEALVRYHSARGLLAIHGLPADANDREHMMYRVMSDDSARHDSGKRDILAAIAARPL